MLVGSSLIFVHNPRTGGNSVRDYLRHAVPDNYFPEADTAMPDKDKMWFVHQGLAITHQYAQRLGLDPFVIPTLVCIKKQIPTLRLCMLG
ncbi:MAG: hypothetical protein ACI9H8_000109 [Lysobacterales bacterium]|jgi:hypothetical protein